MRQAKASRALPKQAEDALPPPRGRARPAHAEPEIPGTGNSVIKTAGRVFEVLEYFREMRRPISIREVSERFGYPLSSTSVLLKSMATLGYLSYDQSIRAYFPTVRVAALGDWVYESLFNGREMHGLVEQIAEQTEETAVLTVQNDIFTQYLQVTPSRHNPIQFHVPPGTRRVLCVSGAGWALLSQQSDETVRKIYSRTALRLGKSFKQMSINEVLAEIHATRKQGYAFSRGTVTEGAGMIAMPLPVGSSGARLAVGVAGVLSRLEARSGKIVKAMRECVRQYRGE